MSPDVRYVRNGGVAIAYQIVGEGTTDLVFVSDFMSNLVYGWEHPFWRDFYERLAGSFRLILYDKRGTGLSDHGGQFPALETRMEDLRAVLEAAESPAAVVLGSHDGCSMAALYAATYPERTQALVLFQPWAYTEMNRRPASQVSPISANGGGLRSTPASCCSTICRTLNNSETAREWFADECRIGASPAAAYALNLAGFQTDLREILPAIRAPTLILHRGSQGGEDSPRCRAAHPRCSFCCPSRRRLVGDLPVAGAGRRGGAVRVRPGAARGA